MAKPVSNGNRFKIQLKRLPRRDCVSRPFHTRRHASFNKAGHELSSPYCLFTRKIRKVYRYKYNCLACVLALATHLECIGIILNRVRRVHRNFPKFCVRRINVFDRTGFSADFLTWIVVSKNYPEFGQKKFLRIIVTVFFGKTDNNISYDYFYTTSVI